MPFHRQRYSLVFLLRGLYDMFLHYINYYNIIHL